MGQLHSIVHRRRTFQLDSFPDLSNFPPEVAVSVLSHLNATDLCLAACVWKHLADNELLWQRLVVEPFILVVCLHFERRGGTSARLNRHLGQSLPIEPNIYIGNSCLCTLKSSALFVH